MYSFKNENKYDSKKTIYGIVEKISIQGDLIFTIVRELNKIYINGIGVEIKTGKIIGSGNIPEQNLILAEILIPTDIHSGNLNIDPKNYIGKIIEVLINNNGIPIIALLSRSSITQARGVEKEDILKIRNKNQNGIIDDNGKTALVKMGYSEDRISNILKEKYINIKNDDDILIYGNKKEWYTNSKGKESSSKKDMSKLIDIKYVSGINDEERESISCYMPIFQIGGKR